MTKQEKYQIRKKELLAEERALTQSQSRYLEDNFKDETFLKYEKAMAQRKSYKLNNTNNLMADVIGAMADRKNHIRSEMRNMFPPVNNQYSTLFDCGVAL